MRGEIICHQVPLKVTFCWGPQEVLQSLYSTFKPYGNVSITPYEIIRKYTKMLLKVIISRWCAEWFLYSFLFFSSCFNLSTVRSVGFFIRKKAYLYNSGWIILQILRISQICKKETNLKGNIPKGFNLLFSISKFSVVNRLLL